MIGQSAGTWNVYIDEAGDEGFKFNPLFVGGHGSSRWFLIAAVVVAPEADRQVADSVNRIKARLWPSMPPSKRLLHWRALNHGQKRVVLAELRPEQFQWLAVAVEKCHPSLNRSRFDSRIVRRFKPHMKTPLYNYTTRLLFEHLTRYARRSGRHLNVTFENRASLSVPEVVGYLRFLETYRGPYGPPTIPPGLIRSARALDKSASKMLQIADVCAGALNNALEPDKYGNVEASYVLSLAPKLDRPDGVLWGRGLKLFPAPGYGYPDCMARIPAYEWMGRL